MLCPLRTLRCLRCLPHLGYAERHTQLLRSVPLTISLEGLGEVTTRADTHQVQDRPLPPAIKDLRFFLPMIKKGERKKRETNYLIIPGERAPFALRRVLAILIDDLGAPPNRRLAYIEDTENQIVTKNIEFYENLRGFLTADTAEQHDTIRKTADAVAERQLVLLQAYREPAKHLFARSAVAGAAPNGSAIPAPGPR